jgi:hypothetical protein
MYTNESRSEDAQGIDPSERVAGDEVGEAVMTQKP